MHCFPPPVPTSTSSPWQRGGSGGASGFGGGATAIFCFFSSSIRASKQAALGVPFCVSASDCKVATLVMPATSLQNAATSTHDGCFVACVSGDGRNNAS